MNEYALTVTSQIIPVQLVANLPKRSSIQSCWSILRHSCSNPSKMAFASYSWVSRFLMSGFGLKERMLTNFAILCLCVRVGVGVSLARQMTLSRSTLRSFNIRECDLFSADLCYEDFPSDFLVYRVFCCLVSSEAALGRGRVIKVV